MTLTDAVWKNYLRFKPTWKTIGFMNLYSLDGFESDFVATLAYPPDILAQKEKKTFARRIELPARIGNFVYTIMENQGLISRSSLAKILHEKGIISIQKSAQKEGIDRLLGDFREMMHYDSRFPVLVTQVGTKDRESILVLDGFKEESRKVNELFYGRTTGRILVEKGYGTRCPVTYVRQTDISLTIRELECIETIMAANGEYVPIEMLEQLPTIKVLKNDRHKAIRDSVRTGTQKLEAYGFIRYELGRGFFYKS